MGKYFSAFPTTVYSNTVCADIIRSNQLSEDIINQASLYYDVLVREGQRADMISYDYYNNSYFDWLVYKANGVVDPYYDWYMTQNTFDNYIIEKYGSVGQALEKVMHYEVNWRSNNDDRLTSAAYEALSADERPYWRPGTDGASYYVRKELDWKVSTNMVVKVYAQDPSTFVVGDYVNQVTGNNVDASGEVIFIGSDHVLIQHVEGEFEASKTISAPLRDVSTATTSTVPAVLKYSIPLTVAAYWQKVNAFDYELLLNEEKKKIRLLSKEYAQTVQREHENTIGA